MSDSLAILLLCCPLPGDSVKPLTPTEYDRLARELHERGLRPADLCDGDARVRALLGRRAALEALREQWERRGIWVVSRADLPYPRLLRQRLGRSCPPLLYGVGPAEFLNAPGVAVVGSREARPAALEFAATRAREAVAEGLAVISGGARGVDTAAMEAAREAGGRVVGVLPGGLAKAVARGRCLVSAFPPHLPFSPGLAMARNGHIYALARTVFVADSGLSGGTWSGAVAGLKRGWAPVYVRGGEDLGAGNAALVAAGARWYEREGERC